jgi:hypothetical protein
MINNLGDLTSLIKSKEPASIVRMGNVEMTAILQDKGIYKQMFTNAGFYGDEEIYKKWKNMYVQALYNCDVLLDVYTCPSFVIQGDIMTKLNLWKPTLPYNENPIFWIKMIEDIDEPIGIISFFKADITRQVGKMAKIWKNQKLKNKNFVIVKAFQSITGNQPHENWHRTYIEMQKRIDKHPHIRLWFVSCGCYGLPLCDYLKSKGSRAVYLGGMLQLLFGLKGKRWDNRPEVQALVNSHWRYPEERPENSTTVEGGCYWGEESGKKLKNKSG